MRYNLLIDENVHRHIVTVLRQAGFMVLAAAEECRGDDDERLLELAVQHNAILLTEDKDFGEWVFAHGRNTCGVILLRYRNQDLKRIVEKLLQLIPLRAEQLHRRFTVISINKVRSRDII